MCVMALDLPPEEIAEYEIVIRENGTVDRRRYNAPTVAEVAGFVPGREDAATSGSRQIRIKTRGERSHYELLDDKHAMDTSLRFVLLYPNGERGWSDDLKRAGTGDRRISNRQYAAFLMHDRPEGHFNFPAAGRLFQEWAVDEYAKVEASRLRWLQFNQSAIRAEFYQGVVDSVQRGELEAVRMGRYTVLPSSFPGGKRYMMQCFQDAMALVRTFGKPDLFKMG
jgi:hypothetical protein